LFVVITPENSQMVGQKSEKEILLLGEKMSVEGAS